MTIPPGYSSVFPYFFVGDAAGFIRFLIEGLGAQELDRHVEGDRIANAQIRIGTSQFMVSEAGKDWPPMAAAYYIYVEDADAAQAQAIAAGAREVMPVEDRPYGDRQGGVRDAWGNVWWISQHLLDGYR